MLVFISTNHYISQSFIKTLKMTCNGIIAWSMHSHFPVLKLIDLKIFRWVLTFIYLSDKEVVLIKHPFVIFPRLVALVHINYGALCHVLLINTIVTYLLLKVPILRPDINGISLKAIFFSSNSRFNSVIVKDILQNRNFVSIFNSLSNTIINLRGRLLIS